MIECMKKIADKDDCFFVLCGTGTEYGLVEAFIAESKPKNVKLIPGLPRKEYEEFVGCCDVGLIFLDHRFTIPNFPSRLLSYMQKSMPVLACTDPNTDIGKVIEEGGFGVWCESNLPEEFVAAVDRLCSRDMEAMGQAGFAYMNEHYNVKIVVDKILKALF